MIITKLTVNIIIVHVVNRGKAVTIDICGVSLLRVLPMAHGRMKQIVSDATSEFPVNFNVVGK